MFNKNLMWFTATSTFLTGMAYVETQSVAVTASLASIFAVEWMIFEAIGKVRKQLPSKQERDTIKSTVEDIKELKKHMSWD